MKIMIWKELRENRKWAALALAGLLIAEIYAISNGRESVGSDSVGITLCSDSFLLVSAFGCMAIGATIGALQILPERRRDQWASLLHRPVSRRVIYLGKVMAGLLLYCLATAIPLLVSAVYAAWPGQFPAPFLPVMALPGLSDILLGTVFYFAALLAGMHSGKWAGSRGAIVLGAIAVLLLHLEGRLPFALPLGASCVLAIAAAGAIDGPLRFQPWISRIALGIAVLTGTALAFLLIGWGLVAVAPQTRFFMTSESLVITTEGQVLRQEFDVRGDKMPTYFDMEGKVVTDERYTGNQGQNAFLSSFPFANREDASMAKFYDVNARASRRYVQVVSANYDGPEIWYRVVGPKGYFVGYDRLSGRCLGICDAEGFKDAGARPTPFPSEPQGEWYQMQPYLYRIGSRLQSFDFAERHMATLLDVGSDKMYGANRFPYGTETQRLAVSLEKEIRILDMSGQTLFSLPYGHDPNIWIGISVTATQDFSKTFFQYAPSFYTERKDAEKTTHLDIIGAQGQRVQTYSSTYPTIPEVAPGILVRIAGLTDMPVPTLIPAFLHRNETIPYYLQSRYQQVRPWKADVFVPLLVWAGVLSGGAVFWARRAGLSTRQTVGWVILTLVFGVAGFVGYRLAVDWPTQIRCPQCGRRRWIGAEACPHCQEAWGKPEANGAEIFEPA